MFNFLHTGNTDSEGKEDKLKVNERSLRRPTNNDEKKF